MGAAAATYQFSRLCRLSRPVPDVPDNPHGRPFWSQRVCRSPPFSYLRYPRHLRHLSSHQQTILQISNGPPRRSLVGHLSLAPPVFSYRPRSKFYFFPFSFRTLSSLGRYGKTQNSFLLCLGFRPGSLFLFGRQTLYSLVPDWFYLAESQRTSQNSQKFSRHLLNNLSTLRRPNIFRCRLW